MKFDDQREARAHNPFAGRGTADRGLNLTITDLKNIIVQLEKTQQAGIRFEGPLRVNQRRVYVRWASGSDQRDGTWLVVTKIE